MMMLYSYMIGFYKKIQLTLLQESVRLPFEKPRGKMWRPFGS
uniref:Alternative protein TTC35 n=1 Tax=Homo sapiens TaxID=9606 RepID=L8E8J8_HUMAN|nr:alternative protein TTC35 [Homo sapiens]